MANRRYLRYLPPDYADGISVPRQKKNGKFLRSPREISVAVHTDADRPHPHLMVINFLTLLSSVIIRVDSRFM